VVMGSSERPEQVVDAEACARLGVDVLKRSTGGGSVLQTGGVLNYSLITPARKPGPEGRFSSGHRPDLCDPRGFRSGGQAGRDVGRDGGRSKDLRKRASPSLEGAPRPWDAARRLRLRTCEVVLKHPPREPGIRRGRAHRDFLVTLRSLGVNVDRNSIEQAALATAHQLFGEIKTLHHFSSYHWPVQASARSLP